MYETLHPITYYFYPLLEERGLDACDPTTLFSPSDVVWPETLLYVHVPYCHDLCRFCPFHVRVAPERETYVRYAEALIQEARLVAKQPNIAGRPIRAVYFGGGSPSILPVDVIAGVFDALEQEFTLTADVEISFEGEPRTLSNPALLELLARRGVSRVSYGLQTFDPVQRHDRFNIRATLQDVENCTNNARSIGFKDINADMLYDLPGQDVSALREDLRRVGELGLDSVDYYNLHYFAFPSTFKAKMDRGEVPAKPDQDMHLLLAREVRRGMEELGLHNVADQIFSRHGAVCEYFRLLWGGGDGDHQAETIALGASARGYLAGRCYMNDSNTASYLSAVEAGRLPIQKISRRLQRPENRGAVFMAKFLRLSKHRRAAYDSIAPDVRRQWSEWGLVEETDDAWILTERGKDWTTNMMYDAFEESQRTGADTSLVRLVGRPGSRTGTF